MKVLHIGKFYPPYFGGIEKVNFDIVEGVNCNKIKVDVLCSNHERNKNFELDRNYKIFRVNTFKVLASTPISPRLPFVLKKIQDNYDIIHIHLPNPLANLAVFLTKPKSKIILHWHSDIVKQKFLLKFYAPLQNWLLNRADKIVSTSPFYIQGSKYLQKFKAKTVSIPLGVDIEELKFSDIEVNFIKKKYESKKIVFALGRLIYYKGFEYLIDAAKIIDENIIILIGGVGKLEKELKQKIVDNDLQEKVVLIGKIAFHKLGSYYKACDLFCLPSIEKSEAFGVVQIEAMAFGKPIVSTNIKGSGVSWVNKNDVSGKIVNPKDAKDLGTAINLILSDHKTYDKYSKNSFSRFNELFTKKKMIDNFSNLYKQI